ncbi:hypothetical protein VVDAL7940_04010 [Vibrio vulnificus]|nr:hypothetical protein VVDAL7940_04010 [Vibrio vulnificus]
MDSRLRGNDGYRRRNFLSLSLLLVILANAVTHFKARGCFESIKPTKSVRSALAEAWIPACAGMTGIESGEISYRPHFCSSSSRTRGPILKRANVFELIKPTKSVCSALAEEWIPACEGMTDIESGEISYRPCFYLSSSRMRGPILKRMAAVESINMS